MTRRPAAGVLAVVIVAVIFANMAACSIQTAGAPKGHIALSATFDDVQSLVVGHSVQVSDVRIGTVTKIRLSGYRARVTMSLQDGRHIPVGTTAVIAKTSLLGENYVRLDLPPGHALNSRPYLPAGATITKTSVAPDLEQITEKVGPLLAALAGQDVATVIDETAAALGGKGERLNSLIKRASAVSGDYAAASADLARTIDALGRLGRTLASGSERLDRLPGNVVLATSRLKADRAQLKRGIQRLTSLARSFNVRIQERHAARLTALLRRANAILASAVRGREELKQLAETVLNFLNGPSVSYGGQALIYMWLKGFLPSSGTPATLPKAAKPAPAPKTTPVPGGILPDLDTIAGPR
ncbi:MlaD family protein [Actinomadura sp. DC4]|uniref:MlaD family protein n=1 Tax=Actinomadura sp. DC4 TaxID=3055069 RepID=UPI0025B15914|nr:MlaD family protein [Actinomadura sp. DC4]MDN3351309.1 MlaD family protein [Actinomadura sp. DC4]